ncbi:putative ribonuclease H-like domain-containing protein [Tanacetum coccineum]
MIDSFLENIGRVHILIPPLVPFEQLLDDFVDPPDELLVDDSESDTKSYETPLISPFLDSDDESDDEEVINELNEYGNIWNFYLDRIINNHNLWDVIINGDLEEEPEPTRETSAPPAPKTAKQLAAKRNQERVKSILLLAIPDEYLLKFHNVAEAKSLWEFENFSTASNESPDKAYDRFQKLISQLEVHGAPISKEDINQKFLRSLPPSWNQIALIIRNKPDSDEIDIDDLYNNLRVYEDEMKRYSSSTPTSQNLAFLSFENTSSTNKVSTASGDFGVSTAGGTSQVPSTPCGYVDCQSKEVHSEDRKEHGFQRKMTYLEEIKGKDLMVTMAGAMHQQINLHLITASCSSSSSDNEVVKERDDLKLKIEKWEESSKNLDELLIYKLVARDKTGLGYGTQLNEMSNNSETDSEISLSVFDVRSSDEESTPVNDMLSKADGYHAGKTNEVNTQKPKIVYESVDRDKVIIEDWNSDDEDDVSKVQTVSPVKTNEFQTVKPRVDKIGQTFQKQGIGFKKIKACFVCKSTDHLIKDCNFHDKKSQEPKLKNMVNIGQREGKPVWDNTKRVNHQNFSKYLHLSKTLVPSGVLTRTGLHRPSVSTAWPVSTARASVSTARPVNTVRPRVSTARSICTAKPSVSTARPVYATRPIYPRMDNVRPRGSCSPIKRAVVNTGKGKLDTDFKKLIWVWRPKGNYLDHVSKDSGSFMLKKGNPEILLQDHAVVDSGCSSHMTGNKAYLSDYEDFNGGFVAFGSDPKGGKITGKGKIKTANLDFDDVYFVDELKFNLFSVSQMCDKKNSVLFTESECLILSPSFKLLDESQVVLRAPRKDDVYSLDLKNIVPSGGITCLYANATADESKLWHRRLGHVNFKNINKLVKGHLVRGLPSKVFVNDHTCVACKKGKQHKASCKAKLERIIRKPLELLHMDLFGPVSVESINKKRYCLVVTDDFSRFSWVFFLATKDETSEILCNLIIGLEKQLNHNVKIIRCDNGTEFKNHAMNEF